MKAQDKGHEVVGYVDVYCSDVTMAFIDSIERMKEVIRSVEVSPCSNGHFFSLKSIEFVEDSRKIVKMDRQDVMKYSLELMPMGSPMDINSCMYFIEYMDRLRDRIKAWERLTEGIVEVKTSASFSLM